MNRFLKEVGLILYNPKPIIINVRHIFAIPSVSVLFRVKNESGLPKMNKTLHRGLALISLLNLETYVKSKNEKNLQ